MRLPAIITAAGAAVALYATAVLNCASSSEPRVSETEVVPPGGYEVREIIFDAGLKGAWQDWGWSRRDIERGQPARVDMSNYGGWIVANFKGIGAGVRVLRFHVQVPPEHGDFLAVHLLQRNDSRLPEVKVDRADGEKLPDGWLKFVIPLARLNPAGKAFNRIVFRARKAVSASKVKLDKVALLGLPPPSQSGPTHKATASAAPEPDKTVSLRVNCGAPTHKINPWIYGIAFYPMHDRRDKFLWRLKPTIRRWGGNHTSRYNFRLGNAWNTAQDWYFENVNYTPDPGYHWRKFLHANLSRGVGTALTIPLIGWAAKDTSSCSFPISVFGRQASADPHRPDAGNGLRPGGRKITPGSPTRTSVPVTPADTEAWVRAIRAFDASAGGRSVNVYILANEPMLWNTTHRDIHPKPVTYDELLERTIAHGSAVRRADPEAIIAGPSVWGWPAYFYSAADAEAGFRNKPDRLAHGDTPFLAWYLRELRAHELRTGTKVLDILNVHFYPQADGVHSPNHDPRTAARRIRSVRALWDPSYTDESWIGDNIELIPRLKRLINENYPGLGISIGEYNFGAERHMSGALAVAEALGRFGQQPDLTAAWYWTYPPNGSPTYNAIRAYRNYDTKGSQFLDYSLKTNGGQDTSLFASRNEAGTKMVLVVLNLEANNSTLAKIVLQGCGVATHSRAFRYASNQADLLPVPEGEWRVAKKGLTGVLPPYSITVVEVAAKH